MFPSLFILFLFKQIFQLFFEDSFISRQIQIRIKISVAALFLSDWQYFTLCSDGNFLIVFKKLSSPPEALLEDLWFTSGEKLSPEFVRENGSTGLVPKFISPPLANYSHSEFSILG